MRKKETAGKTIGRMKQGMRLLGLLGGIVSGLGLLLSALGGLFLVKLYRLTDLAQQTLPVLGEAAQVYLEERRPTPEKKKPAVK